MYWPDWVNAVLGLALIVAPYGLGYSDNVPALWSSIILGVIVLLAAGYRAITKDTARWEEWVAGIAGLLAVIAPFVLGFSALATAVWASVILGALIAILAGYKLFFLQPEAG